MEIIFLKEVLPILKCKDQRTVVTWCNDHDVKIYQDDIGGKKYVLKLQFEAARLKNVIRHLKHTYKGNWTQVFNAIQSNNLAQFLMLENSNNSLQLTTNYKPSGKNEKDFLSILQNETSEL